MYRANKNDIASAISYLDEALSLDPTADYVLNTLAYANKDLRRYDEALDAINRYIAVVPGEPNPYDSRGEILLAAGRIDEAIKSYHKALSVAPDFPGSLSPLVKAYLINGNRASADSCVQAMIMHPTSHVRSMGRYDAVISAMSTGKLRAALEIADQGIGADRLEGWKDLEYLWKFMLKAEIYISLGQYSEAISTVKELTQLSQSIFPNSEDNFEAALAQRLAQVGQPDRAEQILKTMETQVFVKGTSIDKGSFLRAMGAVHLVRGDLSLAVSTLQQSIAIDRRVLRAHSERLLAKAFLELNQPDSAIQVLTRHVSAIDNPYTWIPTYFVDIHLMLGRAYAEIGETDKAAEHFKFVLEYFKDADDGLASVEEARTGESFSGRAEITLASYLRFARIRVAEAERSRQWAWRPR